MNQLSEQFKNGKQFVNKDCGIAQENCLNIVPEITQQVIATLTAGDAKNLNKNVLDSVNLIVELLLEHGKSLDLKTAEFLHNFLVGLRNRFLNIEAMVSAEIIREWLANVPYVDLEKYTAHEIMKHLVWECIEDKCNNYYLGAESLAKSTSKEVNQAVGKLLKHLLKELNQFEL